MTEIKLPPLAQDDYKRLKRSIERDGQRVPILFNRATGELVDGEHRLQICEELGIEPKIKEQSLTEREATRLRVTLNAARRQLTSEQKKELVRQLREQGYTQEETGDMIGVSRQRVGQIESNVKQAACNMCEEITIPDQRTKVSREQKREIAERINVGGETQSQVAADYGVSRQHAGRIANRIEKRRERERIARDRVSTSLKFEQDTITLGDFREVARDLSDDSIDLIFTDPPYDESNISLYGDLAKAGARLLKPGGLCLAYSGHTFLPQVMSQMSEYLEYAWTCSIRHTGGNLRYRKYHIYNCWKPILMFIKPPHEIWWDWFDDLVSGGREKEQHQWQQAVAEAEHYISALCPDDGVVFDPFLGSGTTALAAVKLDLRFIGCDVDEEAIHIARKRLNDHYGNEG